MQYRSKSDHSVTCEVTEKSSGWFTVKAWTGCADRYHSRLTIHQSFFLLAWEPVPEPDPKLPPVLEHVAKRLAVLENEFSHWKMFLAAKIAEAEKWPTSPRVVWVLSLIHI